MNTAKSNIISQLEKEIFSLQGFKKRENISDTDLGLGEINDSFPHGNFPLGAVHEFISTGAEYKAASGGFILCLLAHLMKNGSAAVWLSSLQTIFPPALQAFNISADSIIFINPESRKEILWAMEESLRCEGLAAVICEIKEINFNESRRLQLAVEQSRVTCFIIRDEPRKITINACVSRWKISPLQSEPVDELPGIGIPKWNVELLKIRNGRPGEWRVKLEDGKLQIIAGEHLITEEQKRKVS